MLAAHSGVAHDAPPLLPRLHLRQLSSSLVSISDGLRRKGLGGGKLARQWDSGRAVRGPGNGGGGLTRSATGVEGGEGKKESTVDAVGELRQDPFLRFGESETFILNLSRIRK